MTDWLYDWLTNFMTDWLYLYDRQIYDWLTEWLVDCMTEYLYDWLTNSQPTPYIRVNPRNIKVP